MFTVFILGPAGSGKTMLTHRFGKHIEDQGFRVCYVNLDAAAERLPYRPDFDIRSYVRAQDLMLKLNVGPNTALIKSVELMASYLDEIRKFASEAESICDYVIVDTPGQLELVIFHDSSIRIMSELGRRACSVFLIPSDLLRTPRDLVFLRLLALAIRYRVDTPLVVAISKSDLLSRDLELSVDALSASELGHDLVEQIWRIVKELDKRQRIVKVSSVTGEGLDELHTLVYEVFCTCGDLT